MADQTTGERPRRGHFRAKAETLALLKVSGNPINGLGETAQRRPLPFFWHPPTMHPFGAIFNGDSPDRFDVYTSSMC